MLSALCYGLAGVTIAKGKVQARGDNGVFLSVCVTASLTLVLWLGWGTVALGDVLSGHGVPGILLFVAAGVFASVLGRHTLYRATEQIGTVKTSFYRRLTPVFALPCAFLLIGELPDLSAVLGGAIIIASVLFYFSAPKFSAPRGIGPGDLLGIGSALFYAIAYSLRRKGLLEIPDPAFGTFLGALTGVLWFLVAAGISRTPARACKRLFVDRSVWHWLTAVALSLGQTLQFFALQTASVVAVAVLGSLDVFFSVALIVFVFKTETVPVKRLVYTGSVAILGTAILFL